MHRHKHVKAPHTHSYSESISITSALEHSLQMTQSESFKLN